jgi:molybdenum cofactor cytidylyltransferase
MFTSVLTGANAAPEGDLLILPGDIPFVQSSTMKALLDGSGVIRVPIHQGRRGHPLFLHREVASALRHEPSTSNLREFRDRYEVTEIAVEDPAIDQDIDTIEDYERFRSGKDSI